MLNRDLTTLANAKVWLAVPAPGQADTGAADPLLRRLISAASGFLLEYLGRPALHLRTVTETYDGYGGAQLVLKQWPVSLVASVRFNGAAVPVSIAGAPGYRLQDAASANGGQQRLAFIGHRLPNEPLSVEVVYEAGYVRDETRELPEAVNDKVVLVPFSVVIEDLGVTADGVELTRIRSGDPAADEYKITAAGYQFHASRAGDEVVVRYSYVPTVIEDCVIQMVGQKYKGRDSIGVSSKSLAGQETVTYDKRDMTPSVVAALQPFKRVV